MPTKPAALSDDYLRKLQPKLRMIRNGSSEVNTLRAEQASPLFVTDKKLLKAAPDLCRTDVESEARPEKIPKVKIPRQAEIPAGVSANVFIVTRDASSHRRQRGEKALPIGFRRKGNIAMGSVPLSRLDDLMRHPAVASIELGEPLATPVAAVSEKEVSPPSPSRFGFTPPRTGRVLIGIVDVQGFDFAHRDFLASKHETRWERIWDQGGTARPSPKSFDYGAEFTRKDLNAALKNASSVGVAPQDLERQSEMVPESHGTHVASIAAGNRGVCPQAVLAGVLVSLTEKDLDPRASFYDSTRLAHAVEYLLDLGAELGLPVSINISLGTNGHAHDGSSAVSRWIDAALNVPGRSVCVAAGNAGQEIAETPDDFGYVMGRIHTSGTVAATGLETDIEWIVVGNGIADLSENELELWFSPQDRFAVSVKPPGLDWIGPIEPGQFIENQQLKTDKTFVSIYNELYHPSNGCNYIAVYLSPQLTKGAFVGVKAGEWKVRLHGRDVRHGTYHGWIERDDPRPLGRQGLQEYWNFPSFFSERSNVDNSSVGSLGCGNHIITVANLDTARSRIAKTSSQGPTRDGRYKPDVAAPGTEVVAAKGFTGNNNDWVAMSGTSMASPVVTGLAALMLAQDAKLTAAQIKGILHRTAVPLPGGGYAWVNDAGYGKLNPKAALSEAAALRQRKDRTR
jgi:subtilisin family serine protease